MNQNTERVPFHVPDVGKEEEEAVLEVLRSGWLTTGEKTVQFEKAIAKYVGAKHALAVSSATAGLFLALKALDVQPGQEVYTTPYTFVSSSEVIEWCGAIPHFVDIDHRTFNIDPWNLRYIPKDSVILPVHIAGTKCDMEKIYSVAPTAKIIEDSAHFFPSRFDGRSAASVFSFYATKSITTGEGGMVVTNDNTIAERIKSLRYHGIKDTSWDRYTSEKNKWYYEVHELGYKFNMPDMPSALGLVQLAKAEKMNQERWRVATLYRELFADVDFIIPPVVQLDNTWHLYIIKLKLEDLTIDRDVFIEELAKEGIGVSVHFQPLHLMPYFVNKFGRQSFPVAESVYERCISLPIFPTMTNAQVERVVDVIKQIGEKHHK
jgi:dTDP-4-amino-4,6-dideoxygalactose transaminase